MRLTRQNTINLRKHLIDFYKDTKSRQIEELTNLLINYPTMVNVTTRLKDVDSKYLRKKTTNVGYGAFGEPEVDWHYTINDLYVDNHYLVFFDENENAVVSYPLDLDKLIDEVKVAHQNSFTL